MSYVSQALEWVRAVLFGPRAPGRHSADAPPAVPAAPVAVRAVPVESAARQWGACLTVARTGRMRRRAWSRLPDDVGIIVRPYVLSPQERQRVLSAPCGGREAGR